MSEGIVYILTNDAMNGLVKIGRTSNLKVRMKDLDNTSVPFPFECFYAAIVCDMETAEKLIHEAFGDRRVRANREFFRIDPVRARAALRLAEKEEVTEGGADVTDLDGLKALAEQESKIPNLNMAALGIAVGTVLVHVDAPAITCTVTTPSKVEFDGVVMSLSRAAKLAAEKLGKANKSGAYQGGLYWKLGDKNLVELRKEKEEVAFDIVEPTDV